ncbi:hypothetical protein CA54_07410 [Symmachiella macrocystis]|uniref:BNR/Asp-box repeat protein n=1 Tax=Symmachiella macrocystis TaxID=2527985 RepID=A0A5C6BLC5_9PLAN|nr:exo-alpha-sialidase [Symmachiella macrocystis]TWU11929.1 hypothetical protein CA54_07410 [Symmachiella macrocystis]
MSDCLHVGTKKGLFTLRRNSAADKWTITRRDFLGEPVSMLFHDTRDGSLYCALNHGHFGVKLHRQEQGEETWTEIAAPQFPEQTPAEKQQEEEKEGRPNSWSLSQIWALESGGEDQPGVLWAGTIPGGLFRSPDRGESWQLLRSLWDRPERLQWFGGGYDDPGIHSVCVDPRDSAHVTVGVSCGGVWATRDGGETWALCADGMRAEYMPPELAGAGNVQDPHRLVNCPADPDTFWVQHHNGIFRTTDDCQSWQELDRVQPSGFGFAVAVHPQNPDTAWFVPAVKDECRIPVAGKMVVTRTDDGGQSFIIMSDGLPATDAYDLVYRHALDIDATGRNLVMGSTTGSLWVSSDAGESWQTVSQHLPPVHVTRFAG